MIDLSPESVFRDRPDWILKNLKRYNDEEIVLL